MKKEIRFQANENQIIQMILTGILEIIGTSGLQAVINLAALPVRIVDHHTVLTGVFSIAEWKKLHDGMDSLYGRRGAQGIAIRSGQVFFKDYFRAYGVGTGMVDSEFRMLAKPKRILRGLEVLSETAVHYIPGFSVNVMQDADHWFWCISENAWVRENAELCRALMRWEMGVIQEFLSWTSGGKYYPVQEMGGKGEPAGEWVIRIHKKYIE